MSASGRTTFTRVSRRFNEPTSGRSLSARMRQQRWSRLLETFPDIAQMRVLDLGGTPAFWQQVAESPVAVTVVNMQEFSSAGTITCFTGDACAPPEAVTSGTYDLVLSNSLIEHVGGHAQRERLAAVVHAMAPRHWVQTPYRYFPVEPHWLMPGLQFLPFRARVRATQLWPLGHRHTSDPEVALASVHEVELIGRTQMQSYFPTSEIFFERFGGLPKSMIAVMA